MRSRLPVLPSPRPPAASDAFSHDQMSASGPTTTDWLAVSPIFAVPEMAPARP